ncbi:cyclin-like protein [Tuber brumale]|nr:cyclin-like protein [Tuber brumale]
MGRIPNDRLRIAQSPPEMHSTQPAPSRRSTSPSSTYSQNFTNTYIQRSRPYLTDQQIEERSRRDSQTEAKEISTRLNACAWIMQVGHALQFPIRTMATAMILYHRSRLFSRNPYSDQQYVDVAAAALFVACKIEDTLKKSREILATSYNMRHPQLEPINSDSPILDDTVKRIIGIERVILESSSFDFRYRHAQPFLIKFAKKFGCSKALTQLAWDISVDVYKTLSPLKATPHVLALASLDLAMRLEDQRVEIEYEKFEAGREVVLSVIDDLLELYTSHKIQTIVGLNYDSNVYLTQRIQLNKERTPYTNGHSSQNGTSSNSSGYQNNHSSNNHYIHPSRDFLNTSPAESIPPAVVPTERGTYGTIRFMIDPAREKTEKEQMNDSGRYKEFTSPNGVVVSPWSGRS